MAKFSFGYCIEGSDKEGILTYKNYVRHNIVGEFWDYKQEEAEKNDPYADGGFTVLIALERSEIVDFQNRLEAALRISLNDPKRESQIYELLPFVKGKWDVNDNSFCEELWYASEFIADVLKVNKKSYHKTEEVVPVAEIG